MTKKMFVSVIFLLIVTGLNAQTAKPENNGELSPEKSIDKKYIASISSSLGINYPFGTISGDHGQESDLGRSYSFEGSFGYNVTNQHFVIFGLSYSSNELTVEKNYIGDKLQMTVETSFINISLGYEKLFSLFYAEGGLYYGFKFPTWTQKDALNGVVTENKLYGNYESWTHDQYGIYLGAGIHLPINESMDFTMGIRTNVTINNVYNHNDKLKYAAVCIKTGLAYRF